MEGVPFPAWKCRDQRQIQGSARGFQSQGGRRGPGHTPTEAKQEVPPVCELQRRGRHVDPRALRFLGGRPRGAEGLPERAGLHAGQECAGEHGRLHPAELGLRAKPAVAAGGRLSLLGSCLEGKPVIPVLLRACRDPLHLGLTYLEAADSRLYPKVAQLQCLPSHCVARPGPALGPHPLQRGDPADPGLRQQGQPALVEGGHLQHPGCWRTPRCTSVPWAS
ncbi:uncharacterized protein LOC111172587 isoform X1 [Delphinapterus leucas]|uniref:Uncharacterized protein LOC111172587 isoform X1 n=1 Tax=Delphinapterus leucas TaxID=9749 RepID=A0A2Y9MTA7_DELLE|nr:uncharacterized protein LOC111172587 isoform X1 [Delphinapterus leucas]